MRWDLGGNKRMRGVEGGEKVDHNNGKFTCDQSEEMIG